MEMKNNIDTLMAEVTISREMHRAIMEGKPGRGRQRTIDSRQAGGRQNAGTERGMEMRKGKKKVWRQAAAPIAAAILVMSTMYVGAGYLIEHTPLRDIFATRDDSAIPVPEEQQRPDIYEEILDSGFSVGENMSDTGAAAGHGEDQTAPRGNYGEMVIDNELFSIELLETVCAGRELSVSYILTKKTDQLGTVNVTIDNDYLGQWRDGSAGEEYDTTKTLLHSGFGDSFQWNRLPEGCGYELAENQELCIITQLGKTDYASGTYTLYADSWLRGEMPVTEEVPEFFVTTEEDPEEYFDRALIEITGNSGYGLSLSGAIDMTEEQVHFDRYEVYVSPMTVYLTLDGTYPGEISEIWGMCRSHDITIGFTDGTETKTTVFLSAMGYGSGNIDVDMRASFATAIDPESIARVMLDDVVILGE